MNRISSPRFYQLVCWPLFVFILFVSSSVLALAQTPEPSKSPADQPTETAQPAVENEQSEPQLDKSIPDAGKSAEALQKAIERTRALIAAHRLDTAATELEAIRATAKDNAFRNIASIMLMNVYLEEGNYGRAEALLEETFQARAAQKDESLGTYFALAGQAVNGTRTHLARYRSFGVSTAASLPAEAVTDLNRLRSLLERMIAQAKEISNGRRVYDSLSLLEDVLGLRLSLAKDSEDQARWESEYASARETLASSQTQIASLGGIPPLRTGRAQVSNPNAPSPYSTKKVLEGPVSIKTIDKDHAAGEPQPRPNAPVGAPESATNGTTAAAGNLGADKPVAQASPATAGESAGEVEDAGSLTPFATRKVVPRYPPVAKQTGTIGLVRVYLIVEGGKVVSVSRSEGPMMLRSAAEEAARQWSFQKVSVEGRPTRLNGYIDFNFSL